MNLNLSVKRSELGQAKSVIQSGQSDPAYTGSFTIGGTDDAGRAVVVTFTLGDESSAV